MSDDAIVLTHEGGRWHAHVAGIELEHESLPELDRLIAAALAPTSPAASVSLRFDFASLPSWLRQYQSHYLNYKLRWPR